MTMTFEQLRDQLSTIEGDSSIYQGIGPAEIPLLERLLQDDEPWMASRAVFALSRISDDKALAILSRAAADPRPEVRVAVAASARNLTPDTADNILLKLLADEELGVRKFAIKSVSGTHNAAVHARLQDLEIRDSAPAIRDIARLKMRELRL